MADKHHEPDSCPSCDGMTDHHETTCPSNFDRLQNTTELSVATPAVLREIAAHFSGGGGEECAGLVQALNEIRVGLVRIARRSIEIGDPELCAELTRLGVIHDETD